MGEIVASSEDGMELQVKETEQNKGAGEGEFAAPSAVVAEGMTELGSSVVRWEKFLPKMVMRVLLVEADDSTRQIITALLRKCSYRVTAVPDGLKAWEVLKERSHNVDLILTEVELPSISGYALLTLIMENDICKNIPVIMMSSHDSVSTVYKCMLKGAADFLVKPVRKNELRNLWQHVWRRRASSSGDIELPDESVEQRKAEATAENNAVSNHSSSSMACIQRNRESIEKGSDAQSSSTKPELEAEVADVEHLQGHSQPKRIKCPSNDINLPTEEEYHQENKNLQTVDIDGRGSQASIDANAVTRGEDKDYEDHIVFSEASDNNHVPMNSCSTIDLIGAFDNYLKGTFRSSASNASTSKIDFLPILDLSLRRYHPSGSLNQANDDRPILYHSDASAFSPYVNKPLLSNHSTSPSTYNQQKDHKTNSDKQLSYHTLDYISDTHGQNPSPQKHVTLATHQPGQTEITFPYHKKTVLSQPTPIRGARIETLSNGYGSVMPPVYCIQPGPSPQQSPGTVGTLESSPPLNPYYQLNHQTESSQHFQNMDRRINDATDQTHNKPGPTLEDRGRMSSATDQSANSSFCNGLSHLQSMDSGSNGKINAVSVVKASSECGNEEGFIVHEGTSHRSVQREAALTKFRLKRKDRCFEKKVRYESRKKLAQQRPRVKGQFVRQLPNDPQPGDSSTG
ncbi:pseudo-response regulator 5 [Abeliophyllum distichum]|uniref:Pseudo-response regulator 5 n=1 Tax=Abeliophyllum distichum TaxID=126358 RepID=A0ABD1UR79_9LAMI